MTTAALTTAPDRRALRGALWTVQLLLAVAFGMAGFMKLTTPLDQLAAQMAWVDYTPAPLVRFIGLSELLGAVGLVLPSALRILPWLTPLASGGLVTVMVLAALTHLTHGEAAFVPVNLVLGALAAFVTWGRARAARIAPR
jgi:uncharacterized membrane protein YphA (DoxX/SURF4 family)